MTTDEVARELGISGARVRALAERIGGTKTAAGWRFEPEAVAAFKAEPRKAGRPRKGEPCR
jgi:hypothetical protein